MIKEKVKIIQKWNECISELFPETQGDTISIHKMHTLVVKKTWVDTIVILETRVYLKVCVMVGTKR